jgi:molybdopterin/thiamine biosynthesis adenylyltransferase
MAQTNGFTPLTPGQVQRYSRHLIMDGVGSVGQRKLIDSKVLIIGAGGLGSPVALYLALAGIGTLGIVDFDTVDVSNLQRQILHTDADVGRPKVISAKETIEAHNPDVNVILHEEPINSDNAMDIIPNYDIIVNGADNFATRYLVNDAAFLAGKPLVDGAILVFDGQATPYFPGQGCYRCMFPEPPPPGEVPNCSEAGVIGALPGLVGSIQALEVIKLAMGVGETLTSRMLLIDALTMDFREINIRQNPDCKLCGSNPEVTELIDYEIFCGILAPASIEEEEQMVSAD